jgi:hypothetical protein
VPAPRGQVVVHTLIIKLSATAQAKIKLERVTLEQENHPKISALLRMGLNAASVDGFG